MNTRDVEENITPKKLRELAESFAHKYPFHVGDLVTWKPGMKNKAFPAEGGVAIVVEMLDTPIYGDNPEWDNGCNHWHTPLDIICGVWTRGSWETFYYDSRRFMPLPALEAPKAAAKKTAKVS